MVPPGTDDYHFFASKLASTWSDHLTEAISYNRAALTSCPLDHPSRPLYLGNLAEVLMSDIERSGDPSDIKAAATLCQELLDLLDKEHPERTWALMNLARVYHARFRQTSDSEDLEKAISQFREDKDLLLNNLAASLINRSKKFGRMDCLEEAISLSRSALRLCLRGHPRRQVSLRGLTNAMYERCLRTDSIEDLEETINLERESFALTPPRHPMRTQMLYNLSTNKDIADAIKHYRTSISLIPKGHPVTSFMLSHFAGDLVLIFSRTGDAEHLEESIALFRSAVEFPFSTAKMWTVIARSIRHSSALSAYHKALSLLQHAIDLGPTVQTRHEFIGDRNTKPLRSLPMDAASYAIESRRALLWSGMRSLRTQLEHLHGVDKSLADEFTEISQALEAIITTTDLRDFVQTPSGTDGDGVATGRKDTFARDLAEKRRLLGELEKVVLRIQALPGFENFWRPIPFRHLQTAAMGGPVNYRLESKKYDRVLRQTLEELSELVGQPVANRLTELGIPEQSRIWLCPTSVLASLPIHAAGPIPSHVNVKRYLCDIYVCSYTPSLSALIASRSGYLSRSASGQRSLLIVGQPDETLPGVDSETRSIECLSSFLLQDKAHLTLLRIAKSHLPTAELAFLAACHTAELTEDGTPDEILHLTAAMQFSGFRSVIGTDLSGYFYSKMFAAGAQVASYEKSARALRHATQKLRTKKRVSLERWVDFVHYGA
ncbi:hypothetical protein BJV78DRAFT_1274349 [Lactifluus subvellereus]|nr:hypothetical protein BJV78DRAFT_1274349 [Lactifluus subvellereus]